jgi:ribosomal protein L16 Arg81 hydroxylase
MESLPHELKFWLAENILLGSDLAAVKIALVGLGYSETLADEEIRQAQQHPYLRAAFNQRTKLDRRESLLKTLDYYARLDPEYVTLERKPLPPFKDFLRDYYYRNRPAIFTGAIDHWGARQWSPANLINKVGKDTIVNLQRGRDNDQDYEINSGKLRQDMCFGDFIHQVEHETTNNIYLTAQNMALTNNSAFAPLLQDVGNIGDGYFDTSLHGQSMFLWIGPGGTITPLHHDNTNNGFIQIYGTKRIRMIPSMQAPYVYNHVGVFSRVNLLDIDLTKFPDMARASIIDVIVEPGDFLFIPITWWHHVVGESPSISLTFTNFNAPNMIVDYPNDSIRY